MHAMYFHRKQKPIADFHFYPPGDDARLHPDSKTQIHADDEVTAGLCSRNAQSLMESSIVGIPGTGVKSVFS